MITGRALRRSRVTCGSTGAVRPRPGHDVARGELARQPPERRHARGSSASKHTVWSPSDETSSVIGSSARELAPRARHAPATRNTAAPTGNPPAARRRARRVEPSRVAPHQRLHGRVVRRARPARSRGRPGRAQPTASIQVASARSRAPSPGRRSARSASRIATRSRSAGAEVAHRLRTADEHLAVARQPRRVAGREPRTGTGATRDGPLLHPLGARRAGSRTRSRRTRRTARAPRTPRTGPRPPPTAALRRTRRRPPARRTSGRPARSRTPGSGAKGTPARRLASARTSRGARPSGPGAPPRPAASAARRATRSAARAPRPPTTDTARDSTHGAPLDRGARQARRRARGSTARGPRGARGATRARRRRARGRAAARTPPAACRPPRRSGPRRRRATSGTARACRPAEEQRRRSPNASSDRRAPSPAPAPPRAPGRAPAARRRGTRPTASTAAARLVLGRRPQDHERTAAGPAERRTSRPPPSR